MSSQKRTLGFAVASLVCVWLLAWGGFTLAQHSKMTAEKLRAYLQSMDFSKLSGEARAKALRDLADKLNALSPEERRRARVDHLWDKWFAEMTEQEKSDFIEATMPSGFKQMINAFEQLPQEKRKKVIDDSIKRLREQRDNPDLAQGGQNRNSSSTATNRPPLSPELQQKVATIGLKTFYSESSAQMKAEVAPLLEEIQKSMETGRMFRGDGR